MTYVDLYFAALGWANAHRLASGEAPLGALPKGRQCAPSDGPLANASNLIIGPRRAVDPETGEIVGVLPTVVRAFVRAFDQGAYPYLIKEN